MPGKRRGSLKMIISTRYLTQPKISTPHDMPFMGEFDDFLEPSANTTPLWQLFGAYCSFLWRRTSDSTLLSTGSNQGHFSRHFRRLAHSKGYRSRKLSTRVYYIRILNDKINEYRGPKPEPPAGPPAPQQVQDFMHRSPEDSPVLERSFVGQGRKWGAIAARNIVAGEIVAEFQGQWITEEEGQLREKDYAAKGLDVSMVHVDGQCVDGRTDGNDNEVDIKDNNGAWINHSLQRWVCRDVCMYLCM